ncbi:hypothetical protein ACEPPN_012018 [Leptodophora sp. 'Broadleaf-Isolate-01']
MATTTSLPGLQAFLAELGLNLGPIPFFAAADVLNKPIDIYHSYLAEHVQQLVDCDRGLVYDSIQPANTTGNGDLDVVLPKLKLPGITPKELAGELLKKFQSHPLFTLPFKDGIHLRFFFSPKTIPRILFPYINDRKAVYGVDPSLGLRDGPDSGRKKVLVEFSSPNIATEFTTAHLKSTILGAFVANMYEAMGWDVVRINYLGDWGQHLGLLDVGWKKYGAEQVLKEQQDQFRYIHDLYAKMLDELKPELEAKKKARDDGENAVELETQGLFAERDASFKQMEDGQPDAIALWKTLRDISIAYYVEIYARLGIKFDEYSGESQVSLNPEAFTDVETVLKEKGIYTEQDGAWIIDYDEHGAKLGTSTVRRRDGSTTYLLRDIATVFDRFKTHSFDQMIYVVCEQDMHFRHVFKAVELMGEADLAKKLQHITFTKTGGSSAHLLGDILNQCETHMREAMNAIPEEYPFEDCDAKAVGINSLVIQELSPIPKKAHGNGLGFNPTTSFEGETGSNLQACYARLCSAIVATGALPTVEEIPNIDYSSLWEDPDAPWCELLRLLTRYPNVVSSAFKSLDPVTILSYMFTVVEQLTLCLDEVAEDESEGEGSNAQSKYTPRAVLYENVRQVLENGMKLLGMAPIRK